MISGPFNLLLTVSLSIVVVANRRCLECSNRPQPLDCSTVTECGSHEVCYVDKIDAHGIITYDVGCRDPQLCRGVPIAIGKRDKSRQAASLICSQCCNDTDICNIDKHCGAQSFNPPSGSKLCFNCPYSKNMNDCNQITLCDQDSSCLIKQSTNLVGDSRWTHECAQKKQCSQIIASHPAGLCAFCCDNHLCNMNCTAPPTTTAPSTTTTTTTTTSVPRSPPVIAGININPPFIGYGDNVRVECIVTGNEKPTVEFLFRRTSHPGNLHLNPTGPTSNVMTIYNFLPVNEGMYRCIASNSQGTVAKDFRLTGH